MWHTPDGNRTLAGPEAALIASAVNGIVEHIREESSQFGDQWEYGVSLFDCLTWTQRLAILDLVATHLLTNTTDTLELSAVAEATVGVLFEHVRVEIDWEIDDFPRPGTRWRDMVLAAYRATVYSEPDDEFTDDEFKFVLPSAKSCDASAWSELIESLTDRILWDRDYEMMADLADLPPEKAAFLKSYLGIDDGYFSAAGPDAISKTKVARTFERLGRFGH